MPARSRPLLVRKSIFDPVHGTVVLDAPALALVNTPEFQRLWGIRQTGFAHLVFPGANHTRLEHSLGTYWVAGRMAEHLSLAAHDQELVRTAALLHDLGHAPFSHTFDQSMQETLGLGHEELSRARILGTDLNAPGEVPRALERHGVAPKEVARLVDPPARGGAPPVLRAILHGAVDADRIDYLQRDAHYTGVAHGAIDAVRLLETVRRSGGRLVFAEKGRSAVEGFLVGRSLMYQTVYYHKTVRAAELMAQAALERMPGYPESARPVFAWTDADWLVRVREAGGRSGELVAGLATRQLYKRVRAWGELDPVARRGWHHLLTHPSERRALEDELAARAKAKPGTVLIDLGGLEPRGDPGREWGEIGLQGEGHTTFPFRQPSLWLLLATRPPSESAVNVYAARKAVPAVEHLLARDTSLLP